MAAVVLLATVILPYSISAFARTGNSDSAVHRLVRFTLTGSFRFNATEPNIHPAARPIETAKVRATAARPAAVAPAAVVRSDLSPERTTPTRSSASKPAPPTTTSVDDAKLKAVAVTAQAATQPNQATAQFEVSPQVVTREVGASKLAEPGNLLDKPAVPMPGIEKPLFKKPLLEKHLFENALAQLRGTEQSPAPHAPSTAANAAEATLETDQANAGSKQTKSTAADPAPRKSAVKLKAIDTEQPAVTEAAKPMKTAPTLVTDAPFARGQRSALGASVPTKAPPPNKTAQDVVTPIGPTTPPAQNPAASREPAPVKTVASMQMQAPSKKAPTEPAPATTNGKAADTQAPEQTQVIVKIDRSDLLAEASQSLVVAALPKSTARPGSAPMATMSRDVVRSGPPLPVPYLRPASEQKSGRAHRTVRATAQGRRPRTPRSAPLVKSRPPSGNKNLTPTGFLKEPRWVRGAFKPNG